MIIGRTGLSQSWSRLWPYSASLLAIAAAVAAAVMIGRGNAQGVVMVMLVPVMWSAVRFGRAVAIFTAVAGSTSINLFLFQPSADFAAVDHALALLSYLLVAIVTSGLVSVAREEAELHREQAALAHRRSDELTVLYNVSQVIAAASDLADLRRRVEQAVAEAMGVAVTLSLFDDRPCPDGSCVAVSDLQGRMGCLTVTGVVLDDEHRRMMEAVAAQVAVAGRRARLAEEMGEARILANTERLRAALLSSVSHDFRTPLGTIIGAATGLLSDEDAYGPEQRRTLLKGVLQAAQRLDRFTRNLLDITRIESGPVTPKRDWLDLGDVLGTALGAVEASLAGRPVTIRLAPDLPPLRADFVLLEHVFQNLLENAARYAPAATAIDISGRREGDALVVEVFNHCDPMPSDEVMARLFDKFFRGSNGSEGSGLGLSICRGFVAAHGGTITAVRVDGRQGIVFVLRFPIEVEQPLPELVSDE